MQMGMKILKMTKAFHSDHCCGLGIIIRDGLQGQLLGVGVDDLE